MVSSENLSYGIGDSPPIYLCLFLSIQQVLTMIGGTFAVPLVVAHATCIGPDLTGRAELLGTIVFISGLSTLLQIFFGARLPIIQGASFAFLAPMLAMKNIPEFRCPHIVTDPNSTLLAQNDTVLSGSPEHRAVWMSRLAEMQGAVMVAGAFEATLGAFGFVGFVLRFIGPLTIAPTIGLVGLSFADEIVSNYAAKYWPMAIMSMVLVVLFSLYLGHIGVPFPSISIKNRRPRCGIVWFKVFGLFPVLLSMVITWSLCTLFTILDVLPNGESEYGYWARTDIFISDFQAANWFSIPYPGQWGRPQLTLAIVLGMLSGAIAVMVETIGDFFACARLCGVRPPPQHAINRGIFMEGIACMAAGAFGSGPGITSYSENIGAIAITGVASRRVFYIAAFVLIIFGTFTKFAAFFMLIPSPVLGGLLITMVSMVSAVGFSNLQFVDLNLPRNLFIFGLSMFLGISLPLWIRKNHDFMNTGIEFIDQILIILMSTGMLVGGLVGFILDNTVPGATPKQRGMNAYQRRATYNSQSWYREDCYSLALFGNFFQSVTWCKYVPVSPTYDSSVWTKRVRQSSRSSRMSSIDALENNDDPLL